MNEQQLQSIVEQVLAKLGQDTPPLPLAPAAPPIMIEPSARHLHLSPEAFAALFGPGAKLTQKRALSQPGEFLSEQRVNIVTSKGVMENVAVLGPLRKAVQFELSRTDCRKLGIKAPVNLSGDLRGAADVVLVGPAGVYDAKGSAIVAQNHIHMTPEDAARYGVADGQTVRVRAETARLVTFEQVIVRVSDKFALAMHIDFDEANACGLTQNSCGILLNAECRMQNAEISAISTGEKVITESLAKSLCGAGCVTLRKGAIVTPSAQDVFRAAKCDVMFV